MTFGNPNTSQHQNSPESDRERQTAVTEIINNCNRLVADVTDDTVAYLRTEDRTIIVTDFTHNSNHQPSTKRSGLVPDLQIQVLHWLDSATVGYGSHERITCAINYVGRPLIGIERNFEVCDSNDDSRWVIKPEASQLPDYLKDDDEGIAEAKQKLEGLQPTFDIQDAVSKEQIMEAVRRSLGDDPIARDLGLLDVGLTEIYDIMKLLVEAEVTTDPYFESP